MNKPLAIAIGGILAAGAAIGAYRTGIIGPSYAEVTSARPIMVKDDVYADVVDVKPVTRTENVSQQVCDNKQVRVRQPERFGNTDGTIIGAVVGGLVGNQIGRGSGRTLATVGGAVAGGYAGHEIDERHQGGRVVSETQRVCHTETGPKTTTIGYDVQYRSDGQLLSTRVNENPGDQIWLGQQDRVIGYDVTWSYKDQRGHVRMDHDPGKRLPMRDGTVVTNETSGRAANG